MGLIHIFVLFIVNPGFGREETLGHLCFMSTYILFYQIKSKISLFLYLCLHFCLEIPLVFLSFYFENENNSEIN